MNESTAQHSTAQHSTAQHSTAQISFVIPVYNVKPYLVQCLESVIRTNVEKEIILIDDGSTDGSREILEQYQQKYPYITLVCQSNRGVSFARNVGIKLAKGEYLQFIDPDDYLLTEDYATPLSVAKNHNADMLRGQFLVVRSNGDKIKAREPLMSHICKIPENATSMSSSGDTFLYAYIRRPFPVVWLGFYRTEFLHKNQILFHEGIQASEDHIFMIDLFSAKPNSVVEYLRPIYAYRDNPNSLSERKHPEIIKDVFKCNDVLYKKLNENHNKEIAALINKVIVVNYGYSYKTLYPKFDEENKEKAKCLFTPEIIERLKKIFKGNIEL